MLKFDSAGDVQVHVKEVYRSFIVAQSQQVFTDHFEFTDRTEVFIIFEDFLMLFKCLDIYESFLTDF